MSDNISLSVLKPKRDRFQFQFRYIFFISVCRYLRRRHICCNCTHNFIIYFVSMKACREIVKPKQCWYAQQSRQWRCAFDRLSMDSFAHFLCFFELSRSPQPHWWTSARATVSDRSYFVFLLTPHWYLCGLFFLCYISCWSFYDLIKKPSMGATLSLSIFPSQFVQAKLHEFWYRFVRCMVKRFFFSVFSVFPFMCSSRSKTRAVVVLSLRYP